MTPADRLRTIARRLHDGLDPLDARDGIYDVARELDEAAGWGWPSDPWAHFTGDYLVKAAEEGRFTDADIDVIADLMAHADETRTPAASSGSVPNPHGKTT